MRGRARGGLTLVMVAAVALGLLPACAGRAARPQKDKYSGLSAQQIYDVATKQMEKRRYATARDTLQKALGRANVTPDVVARVHLALADAFFYDGGILNLAEAQSRYTNFLTFYPNHERADYAQYQLGLCYLKQAASPDRDQAQTRKALAELTKVSNGYPNSEYVSQAESKANEAREILAEHDFRIGYFYFRRRSYTGAVDRFRDVLERYPNYTRKDKLYFLLGQSLLALEKQDEGRIYLEKLVAEFPESRYADDAQTLLQRTLPATASGR